MTKKRMSYKNFHKFGESEIYYKVSERKKDENAEKVKVSLGENHNEMKEM